MKTWLPIATDSKGGGLSSGRLVTSHEKPSLSVGSSDQSLSPVVATRIRIFVVATARQVRGSLGEAAVLTRSVGPSFLHSLLAQATIIF